MTGLPEEIRAAAEFSAVEDILLPILRERLAGVQVSSLISKNQTFPLVLVRRDTSPGGWSGDPRFVDTARVMIQALCTDPDGDQDAAILAEAVRVAIREAVRDQAKVPGYGYLSKAEMKSAPRRVPDWATSSGPVQFADLPTGVWRYESLYQVEVRKPRANPYATH